MQANGTLTPLHAKTKRSPFVYLREHGDGRFLVALNPAAQAVDVTVAEVAVGAQKPEIGRGVEAVAKKKGTALKMSGVSYAVYRL